MSKLPTLSELLKLEVTQEKKAELYKLWLNQSPPDNWLKKVPVGGGKDADYLPIEAVEHLLITLMVEYRIEIKQVLYHLNVVNVTVRLYFTSPIDGIERYHDGCAGFEMYHSEKTGGIDRTARTASQAAKTFAIKDAAENIGNIFGKNLNRKMVFDYAQKFMTNFDGAEAVMK